MKCAIVFALAVAAAATQAPVISLDLSTLSDFERLTNHKSQTLGLEVNNRNVGAYQDYVARCPAGADQSFKTCPMPKANAYDHNDQKVKVTTSVHRIRKGGRVETIKTTQVNFKQTGSYLFKFNSQDKAGNRAEEVVFALLIDDLEKPTISCKWPTKGEAGVAYTLPGCKSTDNVRGSPKISYTIADTSVRNANYHSFKRYINGYRRGTFKVTVTANDLAGMYGHGGRSNTKSVTYTYTTKDTTAPVIHLRGSDPATTECAGPYTDAGAYAKDPRNVDKNVRVTSDYLKLSTKVVGTKTVTFYAKDFSGNRAAPVKRHVKVVDTTAPYSIKFTDGTDRQTVVIGAGVTHPKIQCADKCDSRFSYKSQWKGTKPAGRRGTYTKVFSCTDPSGNSRSLTRHYVFQDKKKPVINIVGMENMKVEASVTETYTDQGASCYDAHDGNLKVHTSGSATSSKIGTSTITYRCCDASNNCQTAARTVTTKDTTCPKVELIGHSTIKVEAQGTYTEQGANVVDSFWGTTKATYTTNVNTKVPATYTVTYTGADASNNKHCKAATREVIVQDTLPPVITLHLNKKVVASSASSSFNPAGTKAGNPFIRMPRLVFMEQVSTNGWFIAAAASAVVGAALLATGSRKTSTQVPV